MATSKADIQRLHEKRTRLLIQLEALKNQIGGLEMAIAMLSHETGEDSGSPTSGQVSVKAALLDLLKEVGATGLTADSAVEIAARRSVKLHRGSVSSTLSRMKKENVVVYDGKVYRLPEHTRPSFTVLPLPGGVPKKSLLGS